MTKPTLTALQIQAELQKRVNQIREIIEDKANVVIPQPYLHELDKQGCNWDISSVRNGGTYMASISQIIGKFRLEVDLKK